MICFAFARFRQKSIPNLGANNKRMKFYFDYDSRISYDSNTLLYKQARISVQLYTENLVDEKEKKAALVSSRRRIHFGKLDRHGGSRNR